LLFFPSGVSGSSLQEIVHIWAGISHIQTLLFYAEISSGKQKLLFVFLNLRAIAFVKKPRRSAPAYELPERRKSRRAEIKKKGIDR